MRPRRSRWRWKTELLDAENKKLSIGTSTPLAVILVQRDLSNAQLTQVQAVTAYALAKVQLDQAVGSVLETNHVEIAEARSGKVASPPRQFQLARFRPVRLQAAGPALCPLVQITRRQNSAGNSFHFDSPASGTGNCRSGVVTFAVFQQVTDV